MICERDDFDKSDSFKRSLPGFNNHKMDDGMCKYVSCDKTSKFGNLIVHYSLSVSISLPNIHPLSLISLIVHYAA